jgi:hypothetical protein
MDALVTCGEIAIGIVYMIGFFTSLHDVLENGPNLEDFRKKYGKDLGVTLCGFHHGFKSVGWPLFGGIMFGFGLIRDTYRVVLGKAPKTVEK